MRALMAAMAAVLAVMPMYGAPAAQATGTIEGRVRFEGAPPAGVFVPEGGVMQKTLHVSAAGGLQYAVVYLPDGALSGPAPASAVRVDQRQFMFVPPVVAVRAGQPVQ